jgi:hypothetical protein
MRRSPILVLLATVAISVAGPLSGPAGGEEAFGGTFRAVASADGVRTTLLVPHAPLSNTVMDMGGPSAQATLDTSGTSQAFASFPYPGENVVTAPGIVAGASKGQINLPAYPFYVLSDRTTGSKQEFGSGPFTLKAESTDTSSSSAATVGVEVEGQGAAGLAKSQASTISKAEVVTAEAKSESTSFSLGPLRLGQVISTAKVELAAGGALTRSADTRVIGAMVGDTPVALTPQGLVVGNTPVPSDPAPVQQALAQAQITVELMPRQEVPTGVVAPTVRVSRQDESGMVITHTFGAAVAQVEGSPAESDFLGAVTPPTEATGEYAPSAEPGSAESSTSPTDAASSDGLMPSVDVGSPSSYSGASSGSPTGGVGDQTSVAQPAPSVSPDEAPVAGVRSQAPGTAQLATRLLVNGGDARPLFWVLLALVAIVMLGVALLTRKMESGVR